MDPRRFKGLNCIRSHQPVCRISNWNRAAQRGPVLAPHARPLSGQTCYFAGTRLCALEDTASIDADLAKVVEARSVAHHPAGFGKVAKGKNRGERVAH